METWTIRFGRSDFSQDEGSLTPSSIEYWNGAKCWVNYGSTIFHVGLF